MARAEPSTSAGGEGAAGRGPTVHHRSARQRRGRPPARMQLNLTAMIDVIFLLLVYFVMSANFAADEGVLTGAMPAPAPDEARASLAPPTLPLRIQLRSAGPAGVEIRLGATQPVSSFTQLGRQLAELQYDPGQRRLSGMFRPDDPVIIETGPLVRWQHVVNALNAARGAGYTNVRFEQRESSGA